MLMFSIFEILMSSVQVFGFRIIMAGGLDCFFFKSFLYLVLNCLRWLPEEKWLEIWKVVWNFGCVRVHLAFQ